MYTHTERGEKASQNRKVEKCKNIYRCPIGEGHVGTLLKKKHEAFISAMSRSDRRGNPANSYFIFVTHVAGAYGG